MSEIIQDGMVNVPIQQSVITTAHLLLQRKKPVLIIGDKQAEEVYQEILACYKLSNEASQVCSFNLHCLSEADMIIGKLKNFLLGKLIN